MVSESELRQFFRRVPVALYRTAPSGEVLAANAALADLLGFSSVADMEQAVEDVGIVYVDPDARQAWIDEIAEAGVVVDFDVELRRPDGTTVWVQDTARAVRNDAGEVAYFEGALIDMTEKVRVKKANAEFVATVSHELRNPIAVMLGLGEELANNYDSFSEDDRLEMANLIARQAEDASWLIEDLLVAYRDDAARIVIVPQRLDITKQIERVLEVSEAEVTVEVGDVDPHVHADPRRTRQIVRNLISNAVRYGTGPIMIRVEQTGDRVETSISDRGEEITGAEVERIFRPFETGRGVSHPKSVGLGLSVARRLARLMDGDLVYRYANDQSTFVLSLPAS